MAASPALELAGEAGPRARQRLLLRVRVRVRVRGRGRGRVRVVGRALPRLFSHDTFRVAYKCDRQLEEIISFLSSGLSPL